MNSVVSMSDYLDAQRGDRKILVAYCAAQMRDEALGREYGRFNADRDSSKDRLARLKAILFASVGLLLLVLAVNGFFLF